MRGRGLAAVVAGGRRARNEGRRDRHRERENARDLASMRIEVPGGLHRRPTPILVSGCRVYLLDRSRRGPDRVWSRCEGQSHLRAGLAAWRSWRFCSPCGDRARSLPRRPPKPAARGRSRRTAGRSGTGAGRRARRRSTARGCGSGTSSTPKAAASRGSSPTPRAPGSAPSTSSPATAAASGASSTKALVNDPAPRRPRRLRLAVRLRRQPGRRGARSARSSVERGADCLVIDAEGEYEGKYASADRYIRALRAADRRKLPGLARRLPLCRLPPGLPLLGLLRPGRRPVQPAADVLEGDRHLGADRLRAHLPLQPALGAPDLPARPDLRTAPTPAEAASASAASPPATQGLPPSWWDWQETSSAGWQGARRQTARADHRLPADRRPPDAEERQPAATSSSGPRST